MVAAVAAVVADSKWWEGLGNNPKVSVPGRLGARAVERRGTPALFGPVGVLAQIIRGTSP